MIPLKPTRPNVLEFFAGIGLARVGLEKAGFRVSWSNDFEPSKRDMYEGNFGQNDDHSFVLGDIGKVNVSDLPTESDVAWASSPCTDLSLAGGRAGLSGRQSGTFWQFIRLLEELGSSRPPVVVLENVHGLATSHGGDDISAAIRAFNGLGYSVDVISLDARRFLPQSRPRLFLVGALNPPIDGASEPHDLRPSWLEWIFADPTLQTHRAALPSPPPFVQGGFGSLTEEMDSGDERWWELDRTERFLSSLSAVQKERVRQLQLSRTPQYRTAYRRTRAGVAVWEVRPDDISGCLRTARGGSSKQAVVRASREGLAVRWMTPLEYARLMGAGDYSLKGLRPTQALFGFGDAVAVPAVNWLAENYLMSLVRQKETSAPLRSVSAVSR